MRPLWENPLEGRTLVIACGANRAPESLVRKFKGFPHDEEVFLLPGTLQNYEIVLSAFLGAGNWLPATPMHRLDSHCRTFLISLTPTQLRRIHESEKLGSEYEYAPARGGSFTPDLPGLPTLHEPMAYFSLHGALPGPILLESEQAQDRGLQTAMEILNFPGSREEFIQVCKHDAYQRYAFDEALAKSALPAQKTR